VLEKTLTLLETEADDQEASSGDKTATDASDLILRNPQYGLDIAQMLQNIPDAQHTFYATVLSNVSSGWTPPLRERYFKWFYEAFNFKGGHSYVGYINQVRQKALENVPKDQFDHYNQISGDSLITNSGKDLADLPQPEGPGKDWNVEAADSLFDTKLVGRDFERGRNMYLATRCASCHTMQGEGGFIGPDLTQLGTRFSPKDMLEAIVEPNAVISDQYAATVLSLKDGNTVVGRLVNEDEEKYYVSQNPFAPDYIREISKAGVQDKKLSAMSVMPPGLIRSLNEEELKDLIAYLMGGGNENHEVFQEKSSE
jgi:putative heme-binding domain-containing protein